MLRNRYSDLIGQFRYGQRAFNSRNGIVVSLRAFIQLVSEGVIAFAHFGLAARYSVRRAFAISEAIPAHGHFIIRQSLAIIDLFIGRRSQRYSTLVNDNFAIYILDVQLARDVFTSCILNHQRIAGSYNRSSRYVSRCCAGRRSFKRIALRQLAYAYRRAMRLAIVRPFTACRRNYDFIRVFSYSQSTKLLSNLIIVLVRVAPIQSICIRRRANCGLRTRDNKVHLFTINQTINVASSLQRFAVIRLGITLSLDRHRGGLDRQQTRILPNNTELNRYIIAVFVSHLHIAAKYANMIANILAFSNMLNARYRVSSRQAVHRVSRHRLFLAIIGNRIRVTLERNICLLLILRHIGHSFSYRIRNRGAPASEVIAVICRYSRRSRRCRTLLAFVMHNLAVGVSAIDRAMLAIIVDNREYLQLIVQLQHQLIISGNRAALLSGIQAHVQQIILAKVIGVTRHSRALIASPAVLGLIGIFSRSLEAAVGLLQHVLHRIRSFINLLIGKGYFGALFGRRQHSGAGQLPHVLHAIFRAAGNHLIARAGLRIFNVRLLTIVGNRVAVLILVMDDHLPGSQLGVVEDNLVIIDHSAVFQHSVFNKGMGNHLLISNVTGNIRRFNSSSRANQTRRLRHQIGNILFYTVIINIGFNVRAALDSSREHGILFVRRNPLGPDIPMLGDGRIDKAFVQRAGAGRVGIPTFKVVAIAGRISGQRIAFSILIESAVFAVIRRAQRMVLIHTVRSVGIISAGVIQMILNSLDRRNPLCKYLHIMRGHFNAPVKFLIKAIVSIPSSKFIFRIHAARSFYIRIFARFIIRNHLFKRNIVYIINTRAIFKDDTILISRIINCARILVHLFVCKAFDINNICLVNAPSIRQIALAFKFNIIGVCNISDIITNFYNISGTI